MNPSQVGEWPELAMRTGPFFFALLLFYLAWRFGRLQTRASAGAQSQRRLWLGFSFASYLIAVAVMGCALYWWLNRPTMLVYRATLENLKPYEQLGSDRDGHFFREEVKASLGEDEERLRNLRFVALRTRPCTAQETLPIEYRKQGGRRETLEIPCVAEREDVYAVEWDAGSGRNVLKRISKGEPITWIGSPFLKRAYAQAASERAPSEALRVQPPAPSTPRAARPSPRAPAVQAAPPAATPPAARTLSPEAQKLVALLQNSRTSVGERILALDTLEKYDAAGITALMKGATEVEPVAATLLDLTRHADSELAWKAKRIVAKFNLEAYLVNEISSPTGASQIQAQKILAAMEPAQAKRVLAKLPETRKNEVALATHIAGGAQPLPTGTSQGDRYYVKATWNPVSVGAVQCLAALYNQALLSKRSLAQERELLRGRKERLVFGYSRDWALWLAAELEKCGAKASFVVPWKKAASAPQ